jgi:ATP-dependent RNA helicase RhlE
VQSFRPRRRRSASAQSQSISHSSSQPRPQQQQPVAQPAPPPVVLPTISAEAIAASPFTALGVMPQIVNAVLQEGYNEPTPIQHGVIGAVLEGRDVLACAQTGTGKTAAFLLPMLQQLVKAPPRRGIRALVLTPTRELAAQIAERISAYGRHLSLRHTVIYGGVGQHKQEVALRQGVEIVVATPGRLLDLIQQGYVRLETVEHFVLDEADRML